MIKPSKCEGQNAKRGTKKSRRSPPALLSAFTLLEVMIAAAIFFMAIFSILALVSASIRNARYLQQQQVDGGIYLADAVQTNILTYGPDSGDLYRGYRFESKTYPIGSNGFSQVDVDVYSPHGGKPDSSLSVFLFRPDTPSPQ